MIRTHTKDCKTSDYQLLNEDANKLLARFITIGASIGSVINFVARFFFTTQSKIEITAASILLLLLGIVCTKLGRCKRYSKVVTHILSIIVVFIVVSMILSFAYNGGVTIWAISLLCLIIGVVSVNKITIIYNTIAAISVEIYLWRLHPYMKADLDPSDYIARIGIYLIALVLVYVVNGMLAERMRKNLKHLEDIKEKNEEIITLNKEIYRLVSESTSDGIWRYDLRNKTQIYSQWWLKILGYTQEELLGLGHWLSLIHKSDLPSIERSYSNYLNSKMDHFEKEGRMRHKSGEYLWVRIKIKALFDNSRNPYMVVGAYTDITPLKEKEARLNKLAFYDSLTRLPNRQHFLDKLKTTIEAAASENRNIFVVFIDLDNFKKINDSMGHYYGDILLSEISHRFSKIIHEPCFLGRLGGDEFSIIIQGVTELQQVETYMQELMDCLKDPVMLNNTAFRVSASLGVSIFPENGSRVDELLRNADTAMYMAKYTGKNNYKLFNQSMGANLIKKINIENKLVTAIENDEFYLVYQPQFSLKEYNVRGFEALIRWNNSELGHVSPMDFIPLAEETGYITSIGKWVLQTACSRFRSIQKEFNYYGTISVNISAVQFKDPQFLNLIKDILNETGLDPKYLELEITETVFIDSFENAIKTFNELKKLGIKISLDDFGTGYSSLSYLQQLPIDTLKIDKSFIRALGQEDSKNSLVIPIISLVHNMNILTVAEGVETEEQLNYLKDGGCDCIQGFLLGKPTEDIEKYLKNHP